MGSPLYFIEGIDTVSPQLVEACGLSYALAPGCSHRMASQGPGESPGAVCSLASEHVGYFPDRQTWHDLGERGGRRVWFGYVTDSPPGPDDLLRPTAITGEAVTLFDDRVWQIPRAIAFEAGGMRLVAPAAVKWTGGKWMRGQVKAAYRRLDEIGRGFWDRFMVPIDDPAQALSGVDCIEWAIEVLGVNYRVGRDEVSALGLLDDQAEKSIEILKAVIDYRGFQEHANYLDSSQKKSD